MNDTKSWLFENVNEIDKPLAKLIIKKMAGGGGERIQIRSQDGRGIGPGDHFLPYKLIKRSFECWETSTKQFLNAGGVHQGLRKAAHSLWKEVGQNIKDKKRDKRVRDGDLTWRGSCEGEAGNPLTGRSAGRFGISEGNITVRKTHTHTHTQTHTHTHRENRCLTATASREVAQTHIRHQWGGAGQGGADSIIGP